MPNKAYTELLEFLMPLWNSDKIDVMLRMGAILGMQGTGKTTLAMTIANDLAERFGDDFICLKGFWLHKLIPEAKSAGVLKGKKYVLVVLEDATTVLHSSQSRVLLSRDMVYFWRLRHELKEASIKTHTAKIAMLINMHSYMTMTKYLRNTHVVIIKSIAPKWQRFEHEDITLRWLDNIIAKELTKMLFSNNVEEVHAALSKALIAYHTGHTDIIKYEARKKWPEQFFENNDIGIEEEEAKDEDYVKLVGKLVKALTRLIDELNLQTKVNRKKYLLVRVNSHWLSLGPIAQLIKRSN